MHSPTKNDNVHELTGRVESQRLSAGTSPVFASTSADFFEGT
jgi:hypothetical protein